ncbi:MAG TPA: hypothetical protein VFF90_11670 [Saprospiraceae bacterium]|nr:hypothetical protein [Saprospiraceae bacterium]
MAKKTSTGNAFGIKLRGIELLNVSLIRLEHSSKNLSTFLYNVRIVQDIDKNKKLVFIIVHVDIHSTEEKKDVGSLSVSHIYELANFEEAITILDEHNFKISESLNDILNSISISTTRGVMFSTFKGTLLHNAILPIVNPKHLDKT